MAPTSALNYSANVSALRVSRLRPPLRRRWWPTAVAVVVWATHLLVVCLWVSNGGVGALAAGAGPALSSIGRLLALLSSNLLLLQVFAMARIPWAERALGQDRIIRWHRVFGFTSLNLMLAHVVATTAGYSALERTGVWDEFWSLVTTAPGMLLATAATALFVLLAVTSVRAARRRLRFESWHLLHLYAYLGAGLALPHQLWTGTDFLSSPLATAYWWGIYVLALGCVLVFRVAVPLATSLRHRLTVTRVVTESPGVISVYVTGPRLASLSVAAGQFFVWRFFTGAGWTRGHPLSLSAAPHSGALRITLATGGDDGDRLAHLRRGTSVLVEGPYGRLTLDLQTRPGLVVIGNGLGVTPLLALLQDAAAAGSLAHRPATFVRRASRAEGQPLQKDIDQLTASGAVRLVDLVGPRSRTGTPWLPAKLGHIPGPVALAQLVPELLSSDIYLCGVGPWIEAVVVDLRLAGVPDDAVHIESFAW